MGTKVTIAEVGELAERELRQIGRACNTLVSKLQRVLDKIDPSHEVVAQIHSVLKTAGAMSDTHDSYLALRNIADESMLEALDRLDPELPGAMQCIEENAAEKPRELVCHSEIISITDAIGMINYTKKSGTFKVIGENETLIIEFQEGDVVAAYSDNPPVGSRLGEIIVACGALTHEQLNTFLERHLAAPNRMIGDALIEDGLVTSEQLEEALEQQIQELFYRMYQIEAAEFFFTTDAMDTPHEGVRLNVTHLLLEGARNADWNAHTASPEGN